jgi:hypothetical protein
MPITGYSSDLPTDVLLDSGVLYVGSNVVGVSRGGLNFDPGKEYGNIGFDGKRSKVKGLDRVTGWDPKISGTLLEFGTEEMPQLEPGSVNDAASPTATITPKAASTLLAAGNYLDNVRLVFERGNGKYAAVLFTCGLLTQWSLKGSDNGEGEIAVTIEARLDITGGAVPGTCPYKIELRDALP